MHRTNIEWADFSSNPLRARIGNTHGWACAKISPGCEACYAERINNRFGTQLDYSMPYTRVVEHYVDEKELRHILSFRPKPPYKNGRTRPAVFPCDMTDLFGEWVPDETIDRLFATFVLRPDVDFLILTKRAERMATYLMMKEDELQKRGTFSFLNGRTNARGDECVTFGFRKQWPLPNVWLGVSVEDQQRADERIPLLLQTPAALRFLSCEPLLGPVDLCPHTHHSDCAANRNEACNCDGGCDNAPPGEAWLDLIDWVIVGGESGPFARPMHPNWARALRDQCVAAGVPFFFKQWGGPNTKAAGRELDGRTWDEIHRSYY